MAGIVALFVFGSVLVTTILGAMLVAGAVGEYERKYVTKGVRDLTEMFLFVNPRQLLLFNICAVIVFFLLGYLIFNAVLAIVLAGLGLAIPFLVIRRLRKKRVQKFNAQLVDAMAQMSAAFRAGLTLPQAMENISSEAPPPLGQEFRLTIREMKLGVSVDQALENMGKRVGSEDLALVVTSTNIARQLGGNMAEMFDTIAQTIRERFRLEGKINSMTSQGIMQGWIVGSMPVALGVVLWVMRPDLVEPMFEKGFGYMLILAVAVMETMGALWISRIVNIQV